MSRTPLPICVACALACLHGGARAEVSLGIVSDYRYRGVSLSDGRPALQAGLAWERDDGWYAGAFAAGTRIGGKRIGGKRGWQTVFYLGRAWRLDSGRSWEVGVQQVSLTRQADDYGEFYLGLNSDRWSARVHYQPEVFGEYGPAAYAGFDARLPLGERWLLLGHLGAGWYGGDRGPYADRMQYDGRVGMGVAVGAVHLHLQRVFTARRGGYLAYDLAADAADDGWVFGATWVW